LGLGALAFLRGTDAAKKHKKKKIKRNTSCAQSF
jgi:hypothetical protein